ncbi:Putative multidrug resistance protein MdtD [Gordonia sp. MP11Mi]|uniref:Multidrug resistance protein MdtD n=2 Tax=Gordonia sp. MP11Mi TaxID=3022769 RepID=A0AA97CYY7_9ACTN
MFLVLLDVLAMNVAMPALGRTFHIGREHWSLLVDAYTAPLAIGLLPAGWLVDRIGSRRALLGGLAVFAAASTLGAAGWSWESVLIARCVQGVAASAMLPAGLAALTTTWRAPAERARALGTWSAVSAVATAVGPAVGGVLVAQAGWRAVFWINVPLALLALLGVSLLAPAGRPSTERGGPSRPVALVVSVIAAAVMTSGANGMLQVLTVYLQDGLRLAAGPAGAVLLLATAPFVLLGPTTGPLVTRYGRCAVAAVGLVIGGVGLVSVGRLSGTLGLVPALLGIGVGLGLMSAAIVGETMAAWPARPGFAGGLNNAMRQVGTSIGVVVGGGFTVHDAGPVVVRHAGVAAGAWWLGGAVLVLAGFSRRDR